MKTALACVPCFVRQALEAVSQTVEDPARRECLLRKLLREIAEVDWLSSPPVMGQRIHRIIRRELGCDDPYRGIKDRMNRAAERLLPSLRDAVRQHADPREAAVRVAIGGNLMDSGAKTQIAADELAGHLDAIWTKPLCGDAGALFRAAAEAHSILYLADNAGEIFLDRLLIEALPAEKITLVVRGAPVLNDATAEDARAAGLPEIVPVLDNGSDAPGTVLEDCSAEFRRRFESADLVIAKGQGNYETLSEAEKRIFFLFTVKCPLVADRVGEPVGAMVVSRRGGAGVRAGNRP